MSNNELIDGFATPEGTKRYREKFGEKIAPDFFRGAQGLALSSIGIGTYLGQWDDETDRRYAAAVTRAVEGGINLIDTAANYRFQRSERSIGVALGGLMGGSVRRDELVICTKGGYLPYDGAPPATAAAAREYVNETFVRPGVIQMSDLVDGSHCLAPNYLRHQIDQSRRNMNLATIDVYYLHNPESQLAEIPRAEFDRRLRAAFETLEESVAAGKIRMYGAATWNGFRVPPEAREYLSLERMAELARAAGGADHHFKFVQLPFNLAMPEAATLPNQKPAGGAPVPALAAARSLNLTVVASASLLQGRLAGGLPPQLREGAGGPATDAQIAVQFARSADGVTAALVGMSQTKHVESNLQLARAAPEPRA